MNTDYLNGWDCQAEQNKDKFIELLYEKAGRTNGLYTGLWQEFLRSRHPFFYRFILFFFCCYFYRL